MSTLPVRTTRQDTLMEASCAGDLDTVTSLLLGGTDPNGQNAVNGWTPLHWAAKRGHTGVVTCLLRNGADPSIKDKKGATPGDVANAKCSSLLGKEGPRAKAEAAQDTGFTPSYIKHPEFFYAKKPPAADSQARSSSTAASAPNATNTSTQAHPAQKQQQQQGSPAGGQQQSPQHPTVARPGPERAAAVPPMQGDNTFFDVAVVNEQLTVSAAAVPGTTTIADVLTQLYPKATGAPQNIYADKTAGIRLLPSQSVFQAYRGLFLRQQFMDQRSQPKEEQDGSSDMTQAQQKQQPMHPLFPRGRWRLQDAVHTPRGHYAQLAIFV